MHERRFDPAQAHRLEDPERLTFMPPEEALAALDLSPGLVVADIGAGTGYFAIPLAVAIGPKGRLYAVDVEPAMLKLLDEKLGAPNAPDNIQLIKGDATTTGLPDRACDLVLLANVWHEIEDQSAVIAEVRRVLQPKRPARNSRLAQRCSRSRSWCSPDRSRSPWPPARASHPRGCRYRHSARTRLDGREIA